MSERAIVPAGVPASIGGWRRWESNPRNVPAVELDRLAGARPDREGRGMSNKPARAKRRVEQRKHRRDLAFHLRNAARSAGRAATEAPVHATGEYERLARNLRSLAAKVEPA